MSPKSERRGVRTAGAGGGELREYIDRWRNQWAAIRKCQSLLLQRFGEQTECGDRSLQVFGQMIEQRQVMGKGHVQARDVLGERASTWKVMCSRRSK